MRRPCRGTPSRHYAVGEFARNHGGKVPGRLVTSAKSWLCHPGVDRTAPLLPWSAPPDVPRLSPVEASARYLRHLVEAWNHVMAKGDRTDRLEKQAVVLTVPASFDDVARNLTVEAATKAGLENVVLLEEPQAAFYCWLATHPPVEATKLKPGIDCLVVDVGGGTTDFSLIQAGEEKGELAFVREAVGDHLLLGGDNMDLALAKFVESKLPQAGRLDAAQFGLLTQACRAAKEALLGPNPPASQTVTVIGRGRSVIGGTLHAPLTPDDVRQVIFDGFFPRSARDELPQRGAPGRPARDGPALRHRPGGHAAPGGVPAPPRAGRRRLVPDAILFNGGVFQPQALRDRLLEVMQPWYGAGDVAAAGADQPVARPGGGAGGGVLRLAAAHRRQAHRRRHRAVVLRRHRGRHAGEARTRRRQERHRPLRRAAAPGRGPGGRAAEAGAGTGPRPAGVFPLYTSTVRGDDKPGDVLRVAADQLLQLPPLTRSCAAASAAGRSTCR